MQAHINTRTGIENVGSLAMPHFLCPAHSKRQSRFEKVKKNNTWCVTSANGRKRFVHVFPQVLAELADHLIMVSTLYQTITNASATHNIRARIARTARSFLSQNTLACRSRYRTGTEMSLTDVQFVLGCTHSLYLCDYTCVLFAHNK